MKDGEEVRKGRKEEGGKHGESRDLREEEVLEEEGWRVGALFKCGPPGSQSRPEANRVWSPGHSSAP